MNAIVMEFFYSQIPLDTIWTDIDYMYNVRLVNNAHVLNMYVCEAVCMCMCMCVCVKCVCVCVCV